MPLFVKRVLAPCLLFLCQTACLICSQEHNRQDCSLPLYIDRVEGTAEFHYLFGTLLAAVPYTCSCHLAITPRDHFITDNPSTAVLVTSFGLTKAEADYLREVNREKQAILLIHMSDEMLENDVSPYPNMVAAFRNYVRPEFEGRMLQWLAPGDQQSADWQAEDNVFYFPLGMAQLAPLPSLSKPLHARKHLWSFVGSVDGKPEREALMAAVQDYGGAEGDEFRQRGVLHTYQQFMSEGKLHTNNYTLLMYDTQFVPIPAGFNAEQFRLWEVLEAGGIPVLLEERLRDPSYTQFSLRAVADLGLDVLTVESWEQFPSSVMRWSAESEGSKDLLLRQQRLCRRWHEIKQRVREKFAHTVCSLPER